MITLATSVFILGLIEDFFPEKNKNIESQKDRYKTHISNQFAIRVSPNLSQYLNYKWEWHQDKLILLITCDKLPNDQIAYLDRKLYVRNEAQTVELDTVQSINWMDMRKSN